MPLIDTSVSPSRHSSADGASSHLTLQRQPNARPCTTSHASQWLNQWVRKALDANPPHTPRNLSPLPRPVKPALPHPLLTSVPALVRTVSSSSRLGIAVNEPDVCGICLDPISTSCEAVVTTQCQHHFHLQCMCLCMEKHGSTCPLCRQMVDEKLCSEPRHWMRAHSRSPWDEEPGDSSDESEESENNSEHPFLSPGDMVIVTYAGRAYFGLCHRCDEDRPDSGWYQIFYPDDRIHYWHHISALQPIGPIGRRHSADRLNRS